MIPTALRDTRFTNLRLQAVGVEVLAASELRRRVAEHMLREAERIDFFLLLIVQRGRGAHAVDFERIALAAGRVVFVRPGQVQQWVARSTYEAAILLVRPAALMPGTAASASPAIALLDLDEWPSHFDLDSAERAACNQLLDLLARELALEVAGEPEPGPCSDERRCLLSLAEKCEADYVLMVQVRREPAGPRAAAPRAGAPHRRRTG